MAKIGKALLLEWYKSIADKRAAGTPPPGLIVGEGLAAAAAAALNNGHGHTPLPSPFS